MKAFSVFDDFPQSSITILRQAGIDVDLIPKGFERPSGVALKELLDTYDILFISTAQKMPEEMFDDVTTPKIIGTASSGVDHIQIPTDKQQLIKVVNATHANRSTVTEHTFALMSAKPIDLFGSTMGVIGAGGIASTVLRMAGCFGMKRLCWTLHPENHTDLHNEGVSFVSLEKLLMSSDVISVNIPLSEQTRNLVNAERVSLIKNDAVFVTTSRIDVTDRKSLFDKAHQCPSFGLGMDVDAAEVCGLWSKDMSNVIVTPHIGGGTIESRVRLFNECAENVVKYAFE